MPRFASFTPVPATFTTAPPRNLRTETSRYLPTPARANRVYPGKVNGLIVDYAGVFRSLEKALAIYGAPGRGGGELKPVEDKAALVAALRQALSETDGLCQRQNVSLAAIGAAEGFAKVSLLDDAVQALVASEDLKRHFLDLANTVARLYKAILPDPAAQEFAAQVAPVEVIADKISALIPPADISQVMQQVEALLDRSIATEGYLIRETDDGNNRWVDLSGINFDKLAETFKTGRKRTLNEKLKGKVAQKLMAMVRLNRTRMNYLEEFQALIDAYNTGSLNAEEFFKRLEAFTKSLNEEERRGVGEQLDEGELALFDLLTKPSIELSAADRDKVKVTARELLVTLKAGKLVLDWRKRQQSRAEVRVTIEKVLDLGLPRAYTPDLFEEKSAAVFQHIYDAYHGAGRSVYAAAA